MKLLFYFINGSGENTVFERVEREAVPRMQEGTTYGYEFDWIAGHGKPFKYIQASAVGKVTADFSDLLPMLVVKADDEEKVRDLWISYFDAELAKYMPLCMSLMGRKIAAMSSNVF